MASQRRSLALVVVGTILFGVAIAMRDAVNPWLSNAVLGVALSAACLVLLRPRLSALFAVDAPAIGFALALGIAMVALTHLGYRVAGELIPALTTRVEALYAGIGPKAPPQALTVLLIGLVVAAEELLWRGVAIEVCQRRFGPGATVALVTLLYTLPQLIGGEWVLILAAASAGAVFAVQRVRTKQLTGCILSHFIWSASIFSLLPLESYS